MHVLLRIIFVDKGFNEGIDPIVLLCCDLGNINTTLVLLG
jgi:hypothetical protein